MENTFIRDWCRMTWRALLYLESSYDRLDEKKSVRVKNESWDAKTGDQKEKAEASIGFEVNPATAGGIHTSYLWIGLWLTENGLEGDRPIWIQVLRDEPDTWERLKNEFKDELLYDTDDSWAVGLDWKLSENSTNEEIQAAGEELAERINRVLAPNLNE